MTTLRLTLLLAVGFALLAFLDLAQQIQIRHLLQNQIQQQQEIWQLKINDANKTNWDQGATS